MDKDKVYRDFMNESENHNIANWKEFWAEIKAIQQAVICWPVIPKILKYAA